MFLNSVEARRRARRLAAEGSHTFEDIEQMYRDQAGLCGYCERELNGDYEVDHMIALSAGGTNDWSNIAITCPPCNARKYTMSVETFMERLSSQ